jgi:predicted DNA-binding ribbon-helix-helix protein
MLKELLNVSLSDLLPAGGIALTLPGEVTPYRISDHLHDALKAEAEKRGVSKALLFRELRDELNSNS